MKKYSIFSALVLSFFSPSLYRDVAKNWKGIAAIYLLFLLAITWIPQMIHLRASIERFLSRDGIVILRQMPNITITNGEVSIDKPEPLLIHYAKGDRLFMVIDTTGQYATPNQTNADVFLTKSKLYIFEQGQYHEYDLSVITALNISKGQVDAIFQGRHIGYIAFLYPLLVVLSFMYRILQAILYALIGKVFAVMAGIRLSYQAMYRCVLVALTPTVILSTVWNWFGHPFYYEYLMYLMVGLIYVFFAVLANGSELPVSPAPTANQPIKQPSQKEE